MDDYAGPGVPSFGPVTAEWRSRGTADEELGSTRPAAKRAYESHDDWVSRVHPEGVVLGEVPTAEQPSGTDPVGEAVWAAARDAERFAKFEKRLRELLGYKEGTMNGQDLKADGGSVREMTPNEIRRDEVASLLDFVQGDPVGGAPNKKAIIEGIKFRLNELTLPSVAEEPMPPMSGPDEYQLPPVVVELTGRLEALMAESKAITDRSVKLHAIEMGLDILARDQDLPPTDRLVHTGWRESLATTIAVNLTGIIAGGPDDGR